MKMDNMKKLNNIKTKIKQVLKTAKYDEKNLKKNSIKEN